MHPQPAAAEVASTLPVIIVVACTVVAALAISAWLVRDVAHRAIDRTNPDKVAAVVSALGSLLHPLRLFLPWSDRRASAGRSCDACPGHSETLHNEISAPEGRQ